MKKNVLFLLIGSLLLAIVLLGCDDNSDDPVLNQSELDEMRNEIVALSLRIDCTNALEWSFAEIGSKPCGGPAGHIAYSKQMDTVAFLAKVNSYTVAHKRYNEENGIISDCAIDPSPVGIKCEEGMPVLIYNRCELIPDAGVCNAAILKYYFDPETQECKEFLWGGCGGVVPFGTLDECLVCE